MFALSNEYVVKENEGKSRVQVNHCPTYTVYVHGYTVANVAPVFPFIKILYTETQYSLHYLTLPELCSWLIRRGKPMRVA